MLIVVGRRENLTQAEGRAKKSIDEIVLAVGFEMRR